MKEVNPQWTHKLSKFGLAACLFLPAPAHATLQFYSNELQQLFQPRLSVSESAREALREQPLEAELQKRLNEITARLGGKELDPNESRWELQADQAALQIRTQGEAGAKRSIEALQKLEAANPGQHAVAANLGTAYELAGDRENAMKWIEEAIARNPEPHKSSEWLHLVILQTKARLEADPALLIDNSVLGADFGAAPAPRWPTVPSRAVWVNRARLGLFVQLKERLVFTKPPDPLIGDLLFDLANLTALTSSPANAVGVMELAIEYGAPKLELAQKRLSRFKELSQPLPWHQNFSDKWIWSVLILLLAIPFLVLYMKRQMSSRRRRQIDTNGAKPAS